MTTLKSDCRKFAPNIFNRTKCQNCFRTKDAHSAEALESNRATRKISKCGYLFVAPDWDFSVSINRTKRWQRRWFVLYDDGELTYSVDEHPDTVPQAVIDMNKVLEVSDAEDVTGNQFAIALTAPEKVHFVKGTTKEESKWWFDALSRIPRNTIRGKHKRNATFPGGKATTKTSCIIDHASSCEDEATSGVTRPRFLSTSESIRRKEWSWLPIDPNDEEDVFPTKENGNYIIDNSPKVSDSHLDSQHNAQSTENVNNAINKLITNSVNHRLSTSPQTKQEGKIAENVTSNEDDIPNKPNLSALLDTPELKNCRSRRYLKRENRGLRNQRSRSDGVTKMIPDKDSEEILSASKTFHHNPVYLLLADGPSMKSIEPLETMQSLRIRHSSEREGTTECASPKIERRDFASSAKPLKKSGSLVNISTEFSEQNHCCASLQRNHSFKGTSISFRENQNAVDGACKPGFVITPLRPVRDTDCEIQEQCGEDTKEMDNSTMGESNSLWECELEINTEDMFVKKGWLMRQNLSKEWYKHWFMLKNSSLTYYRDPSAEDCGILDGVLDLNQINSVKEIFSDKYFAFCLLMWDNKKHVLAAVTAGIRNNWIQAIKHASNLWDKKDFSKDEIILPEHNFHTNDPKGTEKLSVSCSPIPSLGEGEKLLDLSSSDDQSEYFSIVDEEEVVERPSSPRALPPSPPVNRTPMSLVKERARTRSSFHGQMIRQYSLPNGVDIAETRPEQHSDGANSDHSSSGLQDFPHWPRKYHKTTLGTLEAEEEDSEQRQSKAIYFNNESGGSCDKECFSHSSNETNGKLLIKNLEERCNVLEAELAQKTKEIDGKNEQLEAFNNLKSSYRNLIEKRDSMRKKLTEGKKTITEQISADDNYKLKYELLKTKYIRDRNEWDNKMKKEKHQNAPNSGRDMRETPLEEFLKVLQKTKQSLNTVKEKFDKSSEKVDDKLLLWKEIIQLCEEIEKISPGLERKMKRDSEIKKLRKAINEMQLLCNAKQKQLEEEQTRLRTIDCLIEKKDHQIQELEQELTTVKKGLADIKTGNFSNNCNDFTSEGFSVIGNIPLCGECLKLKAKLELAREQIRRLKKEIKESHTSHDDLEIFCFKLKQDMKRQEEIHQSQMSLMTARVDDLTSKLTLSERNLRQLRQKLAKVESRQERRRSSLKSKEALTLSKECESKLTELEQKIMTIEFSLREDKNRRDDTLDSRSEVDDVNLISEQHLQKRLSQDSTNGSENPSLLLRLHTLGTRVKTACDAVDKQAQDNSKERETLERPKICLQVRTDEDSSVQEDGAEDWSTLSFTTSMTDLQAIDGLDGEFPCTVSECLDCLCQKIDGLVVWLRTALQLLQKQESGFVSSSVKGSASQGDEVISLAAELIDTVDNLSDTKLEEMFNTTAGSETLSLLCYKTLLLNEIARILQKIIVNETKIILEKISVSDRALRVIKRLIYQIIYLASTDGRSCNLDIANCTNTLEKLISLCNAPFHSFLDDSLEDFPQASHQPPDRLRLIEEECMHFICLLDDAREACFATLWHTFTDMPVQDGDQLHIISTHFNETLQDQHYLLSNITKLAREVFDMAERELNIVQDQNISLLRCEHEAWNAWNVQTSSTLKSNFQLLVEDLKKQCPQVNEGNIFSSCLNNAACQNIVYIVYELSQITVSKTITQNILLYIRQQNHTVPNDTTYNEWLCHLHDNYYHKANFLGQSGLSSFAQGLGDFFSDCALKSTLMNSAREIKILYEFISTRHLHHKKVENMQNELEYVHNQNEILAHKECEKCQETNVKVIQLQEEVEKISKRQKFCEWCQTYSTQLQSATEQHQTEMISLHEQYAEKIDELHKQLQLVLKQKEEAHIQEVQKLETNLQATRKRLSHLEIEYDEQIQNLKEIYEQKMSCKQDPINEESVRRRYQSEIEQLKNLCEKGLVAMENSHHRLTLELERRHKQEIALLEAEKEKALAEETQATLTALEVMRKAHAEELQKEIARFKEDFVKRTQMDRKSEKFQQDHGSQVEEIKHEILSLSDKYSVKCLETASLEERVEVLYQQLQESNHQLFDLMARNKQLKVHLAMDIAQKKESLEGRDDPHALEDFKLLSKLRESELMQCKEENAQLKQDLHLAQMHVSMLDVQCEQLDQSLKAERRLREDEVSSLRAKLEAIISASVVNEESLSSNRSYRATKISNRRSFLYRSPSLNLPNHLLELKSRRLLSANRAKELLRSPSCPGLENFSLS